MPPLPAPAATLRAQHLRCIARALDRNWCPEHLFPNPPDHCIRCQTAWPCDVEELARAIEAGWSSAEEPR